MKILITGGKGMLGRTLRGEFREHEVVVAGLPEADITDAAYPLRGHDRCGQM